MSWTDSAQQRINNSFGKGKTEPRKPSRLFTTSVVFSIMMFGSWSLFILATASIESFPPGLPRRLDTAYHPDTRFEIFVSMYKEDPLEVKQMIDKIKATTLLAQLDPRVTIYTKNPEADLDDIKHSMGADIVHQLENFGREGGTYLSHIVNRWDALALQTMFIQAHAHNMRELIPRINSYLVPKAGMLSLGFAGVTCACNSCGDRFDWQDEFNIIPTLYEKIYTQPCTPSTPPILLSYKGQFVASACRIRGIDKEIYESLLTTITRTDGWSHDETVIGGMGGGTGKDSPDNPYFGFTVERVWSLLMQCATEPRVITRCPTLLSGVGFGGRVEDCGCMDEQ